MEGLLSTGPTLSSLRYFVTLGLSIISETLPLLSMSCVSQPKKPRYSLVDTFGHTSPPLIVLVDATMAGFLRNILVNFSIVLGDMLMSF